MKQYRRKQSLFFLLVMTAFLYGCQAQEEEISFSRDEKQTVQEEEESSTQQAYVHIAGCVVNPGVYAVSGDARIYQVVEMAGGFLEEADIQYLNLAQPVKDGDKILVYSKEETEGLTAQGSQEQTDDGLVNLNTASKETLMTLPGIGESKAEAILRYREEQGIFQKIEDIMNISGIKEGAFQKIKDRITV